MSMKSTVFPDPSVGGRARQEQKDQCDVNIIVAAHKRGAITSHVVSRVAQYGYAPSLDFRESMEQIRKAEEAFMLLPAVTRKHFHNSPAEFVEAMADPKKKAELLEHGLLIPKPKPAPALGTAENPIVTRPLDENPPTG